MNINDTSEWPRAGFFLFLPQFSNTSSFVHRVSRTGFCEPKFSSNAVELDICSTDFFIEKSDPFQNLIADGLWGETEARKSVYVKKASVYCIKVISQLRGAPGRKEASSQDCGSLSCKDSGDKKSEQAFLGSSCL